jgi:hypothetical protein
VHHCGGFLIALRRWWINYEMVIWSFADLSAAPQTQTPTPAVVNVRPVDLCALDGILAFVRRPSEAERRACPFTLRVVWTDTRSTHSARTVARAIRLAAATSAPSDRPPDEADVPDLPRGHCFLDVMAPIRRVGRWRACALDRLRLTQRRVAHCLCTY